jgi:hypothetical protein
MDGSCILDDFYSLFICFDLNGSMLNGLIKGGYASWQDIHIAFDKCAGDSAQWLMIHSLDAEVFNLIKKVGNEPTEGQHTRVSLAIWMRCVRSCESVNTLRSFKAAQEKHVEERFYISFVKP